MVIMLIRQKGGKIMTQNHKEGDLQFLLLPSPSERGWTFKKARKLLRLLKMRKKSENISKELGFSVIGINMFVAELVS